jgi:two-component system nitrogen regulation response regulator GlnG
MSNHREIPRDIDIFSKLDDYFMTANGNDVYAMVVGIIERKLIEKALERFSGNQVKASKMLGIHRNTLHAKVEKLKINVERFKL